MMAHGSVYVCPPSVCGGRHTESCWLTQQAAGPVFCNRPSRRRRPPRRPAAPPSSSRCASHRVPVASQPELAVLGGEQGLRHKGRPHEAAGVGGAREVLLAARAGRQAHELRRAAAVRPRARGGAALPSAQRVASKPPELGAEEGLGPGAAAAAWLQRRLLPAGAAAQLGLRPAEGQGLHETAWRYCNAQRPGVTGQCPLLLPGKVASRGGTGVWTSQRLQRPLLQVPVKQKAKDCGS